MLTFIKSLPFEFYIGIAVFVIILFPFIIIHYRKKIDKATTISIIFLGVGCIFAIFSEAIKRFNIFLFFTPILFILMTCCLFVFVIILATKAYKEKFSKNPMTKKIFWTYTSIMTALILFITIIVLIK